MTSEYTPKLILSKLKVTSAAAINGTYDPPQLSEPEEDMSIDLDKFQCVVVKGHEDQGKLGYAYYNPKSYQLTAYLKPEQIEFEINQNAFFSSYNPGQGRYRLTDIGEVTIDERILPTCRFFAPSRENKTSELPQSWRFAKGFNSESCMCPSLGNSSKNPGHCNKSPYFTSCSGYEEQESQPHSVVKFSDSEVQPVEITKRWYPPRVPVYDLNTETPVTFDQIEDIKQYLDELVGKDGYEITPAETGPQADSYFVKVFA